MKSYIIAEIGINHNGILENCHRLIEVAADAGCSAAKFQTFSAARLYPQTAGRLDWQDDKKKYNYDIYKAVQNFELPLQWIDSLILHCKKNSIDFISSIFDEDNLNFLIERGMTTIKLSSYTITHLPLIDACAKTGFPIIMSTGGATLGEIEDAVNTVLKYHSRLTLLHCSIQYPTALKDCHLGVLETLRLSFPGLVTGYSDHTSEISQAPVQSVYLGGTVIEKHITLSKKMEGPDHFFALEPHELKKMVTDIQTAEEDKIKGNNKIDPILYGSSAKICHANEKYMRDFAFMTLFTNKKIKAGQRITYEDIAVLRAGEKKPGLSPKYLHLFKKYQIEAKIDLAFEDPIGWESIL